MEVIIMLELGAVNKLAKDFRCHRKTVSAALRGKMDTPTARVLRAAALERGGRIAQKPQNESKNQTS